MSRSWLQLFKLYSPITGKLKNKLRVQSNIDLRHNNKITMLKIKLVVKSLFAIDYKLKLNNMAFAD